jgi:hypothetical protein
LIFHQQLQNERGNFVLKTITQRFNSRTVDDVLKLATDASVGAVNLLSDSGGYRFGSLDVRVEPLVYDCFGAFSAWSTAACMSPAGPRRPGILRASKASRRF